jgi:hypothetical protein
LSLVHALANIDENRPPANKVTVIFGAKSVTWRTKVWQYSPKAARCSNGELPVNKFPSPLAWKRSAGGTAAVRGAATAVVQASVPPLATRLSAKSCHSVAIQDKADLARTSPIDRSSARVPWPK